MHFHATDKIESLQSGKNCPQKIIQRVQLYSFPCWDADNQERLLSACNHVKYQSVNQLKVNGKGRIARVANHPDWAWASSGHISGHVSAPAPTQVMWSNPGKVPFAWIPSHHKLSKWPIKRVQSLTDSGGDTQQHSSQLGTKIFEYSWKIFPIICLVHLWFTGWWFMCVVEIIRDLLLCVDCYLRVGCWVLWVVGGTLTQNTA